MIKVLCTRKLNDSLMARASSAGILIEVKELISTNSIITPQNTKAINGLKNTVVIFTSRNAVNAVSEMINITPAWDVYCLEGATRNAVSENFPLARIKSTAPDASGLAAKIIENEPVREIYFFCGNRRRDVLPVQLAQSGFTVKEVVVYETDLMPILVEKNFDGYMFFSPSAVQSFFQLNKIRDGAVCFSIGKTTTNELRKHTNCRIVTAADPSEEAMLNIMLSEAWHNKN